MNPITVIPWDRDFLTGLSTHLVERFGGRFDNLLVLFPHRRPRRYLLDKLAADPRLAKPCLLPRMLSIGELFAELAGRLTPSPLRPLGELDRVGALHETVTGLGAGLRGPDNAFPTEIKDFFPWGLALDRLMEELFQQGVTAANLDHVQDMVMPTAAALLGNLKAIQAGYRQLLTDRGLSTPGLAASIVAADSARAAALLDGKEVLACGFHALTGSEEALLKDLWKSGRAEILWHTDPAVAEPGGQPHWSCEEHVRWLKSWKAKARLAGDTRRSPLPSWRNRADQFSLFAAAEAEPPRRATVTFHQGFDLHSQLMALRRELDQSPDTAGYAIVLPDTSMLMPVLHHLPRRDVNVSMGFPLWRSPLYSLIETILRLQDSRAPGGYHWREFTALLRHPLLKFLRVDETTPLRTLFHDWEAAVRQGEKYLDPLEWRPADASEEAEALRQRVVAACLTAFEDTAAPRAMANALLGLSQLLLDPAHSGGRWERFVIDAACLARLIDRVIPELAGSSLSDESFPPEAVRSMTREMLKRESVPFEADPLSGLQIMGMLETRLISFERVFILGATEEALPGSPRPDPLLPDPLRQSLGLPGQRERDLTQAHTFYRLIQGAREVGVFYSAGVQPGVLDGKSLPSRYVEQLIWEEEKRRGQLLPPGAGPRRLITMPMRGVKPQAPVMENTRACRVKLETRLRYRGVSATLIDDFLRCPLAFFYKYLTPLEPLEEVAEEGDHPAFGQLIHETLHDFFRPLTGKPLQQGELDAQALVSLFIRRLREAQFFRQMPAHSRLLLERAAERRLERFAASSPATTPLELEKRIQATLDLAGAPYSMTCTLDRIDERGGEPFILDYKTGSPKKPANAFWDDDTIWDAIDAGDVPSGLAILPRLYEKLGSIQMPLYMHAFQKAQNRDAADAVFVCLGKDGQETPLFGTNVGQGARTERIQELTPRLAGFAVRLMLETPAFPPQPNTRSCPWCAWRAACPVALVE